MRRTVRSNRKTALVKTNEGQIRGIRTNVEIPTFNNISNDNTNNNIITSSRRILNKRSITIYANNTNDKHNVSIYQFLKIPYAIQPKRWEYAKYPPKKYNNTYDATKTKLPSSAQSLDNNNALFQTQQILSYAGENSRGNNMNKTISSEILQEDCLYLNVYVPEKKLKTNKNTLFSDDNNNDVTAGGKFKASRILQRLKKDGGTNSNKKNNSNTNEPSAPVMVYFHSDFNYQNGFSNVQNVNNLIASNNDCIIVTPSYRLGIFGFFVHSNIRHTYGNANNSETTTQGNYGLVDQILALKWVNDNIEHFGGDRSNITICGSKSGGSSVLHLMSIPSARMLFHKAISFSSSALNVNQNYNLNIAIQRSMKFIKFAVGNDVDGNVSLDTLRNMPTLRLLRLIDQYNHNGDPIHFLPVVDGVIRLISTIKAISSKSSRHDVFSNVPLLIGFASNDGIFYQKMNIKPSHAAVGNSNNKAFTNNIKTEKDFQEMVPKIYNDSENDVIMYYDINEDEPTKTLERTLELMYTDSYFGSQSEWIAKELSIRNHPVFTYLFNREPSPNKSLGKRLGAFSGSDLDFWFNSTNMRGGNKLVHPIDKRLTKLLQIFFYNFMKTSNPNKPIKTEIVNPNSDSNNKNVYEWEPFILATQKTMYFHQVEDGERGVPIDHKKVCEMLYDWKRVYRYGPHIQLLENILAKDDDSNKNLMEYGKDNFEGGVRKNMMAALGDHLKPKSRL